MLCCLCRHFQLLFFCFKLAAILLLPVLKSPGCDLHAEHRNKTSQPWTAIPPHRQPLIPRNHRHSLLFTLYSQVNMKSVGLEMPFRRWAEAEVNDGIFQLAADGNLSSPLQVPYAPTYSIVPSPPMEDASMFVHTQFERNKLKCGAYISAAGSEAERHCPLTPKIFGWSLGVWFVPFNLIH